MAREQNIEDGVTAKEQRAKEIREKDRKEDPKAKNKARVLSKATGTIAAITDTNINTCIGRMHYALTNLRKFSEKNSVKVK